MSFDQVYDFLAIRVITQDVSACYAAFGLIHALWRPVPRPHQGFHRHSPRQPLPIPPHHGDGRRRTSVRSPDPHRGDASASPKKGSRLTGKYKTKDGTVTARDEERLNWIRQLAVEWQKEMTDPTEFLSSLKMDLYPDEVYTFTPKGKVVVVPADGTPVDFAYTIHTEVGHTCVGAMPRSTAAWSRCAPSCAPATLLKSSPRRTTSPAATGSPSVKSPRARNKIKHWLNRRHAPPRRRNRPQAAGA